jgi:hypothetical protein
MIRARYGGRSLINHQPPTDQGESTWQHVRGRERERCESESSFREPGTREERAWKGT